MANWTRDASGCITIPNVTGRVLLGSAQETNITFGLWVVIADSVAIASNREFGLVTVAIDNQNSQQEVNHNSFSNLRFGGGVHIHFESAYVDNALCLYGVTTEYVNYKIYRFWSNLSYSDPTGVVAGTYGSATTVPQVLVDSFGRLVSIQDVTITADWNNIANKPTTVSLSGLTDVLSTSSVIDCGDYS